MPETKDYEKAIRLTDETDEASEASAVPSLVHGGDIVGFEARYGAKPLDFSVNTNPFGIPPAARRAAEAALEDAGSYPDPLCRALRSALSAKEGVPAGHILCGNGAADLIFRLCAALAPGRALVTAPAFAEYEAALVSVGCAVRRHRLSARQGFAVEEDILDAITLGVDMLFLCEPANPTGKLTPHALLERIVEKCAANNTVLLVDECFNGFLDSPAEATVVPLTEQYPCLVVLKAFTKEYAMAGLRLGYCISSNAGLLARMAGAGQPWAVSSVAQAAGVAALGEEQYLREARALISGEKAWLIPKMEELGYEVLGSEANYLFAYTQIPLFFDKMARQGVLIRDCSNYHGLSPGYFRVAVRTETDNKKLAEALEAVAGGMEE